MGAGSLAGTSEGERIAIAAGRSSSSVPGAGGGIDINNSDTNNIHIAPVITLPEIKPTFTNNIDLVDEAFNLTQLKIINHLMVGLVSGSAAIVMNESPLYYGSLGLITSGSKKYVTPYLGSYDTVAAVAGGTAISAAFGKDIISSGVILSVGSLAGNMLS